MGSSAIKVLHALYVTLSDKKKRNSIIAALFMLMCAIMLVVSLLTGVTTVLMSFYEFYYPMPNNKTVSSPFLPARKNPVTGKIEKHNGMDMPAPLGTTIYAPSPGEVILVTSNNVEGNMVVLLHQSGAVTKYKHCSEILVTEGQFVMFGEPIAACGSTGESTGSHLHFELVIDGQYVDPAEYLKDWPAEFMAMAT